GGGRRGHGAAPPPRGPARPAAAGRAVAPRGPGGRAAGRAGGGGPGGRAAPAAAGRGHRGGCPGSGRRRAGHPVRPDVPLPRLDRYSLCRVAGGRRVTVSALYGETLAPGPPPDLVLRAA